MRLLPVSKALAILGATTAITALSITNAQASPIEFDYTFNPTDVLMNNTGNVCTGNTAANTVSSTDCVSLQFSFTLIGYAAATDTLASGSLELVFYDDNTPGPDTSGTHQERVNISLDGALTSNSPLLISTGSTSASPFSTSFDVLAQLQDGALTVLLTPSALTGNNDFFFASSRLIARGEREENQEEAPPPSELPEPAVLLLFGTAAVGLVSRKARNR